MFKLLLLLQSPNTYLVAFQVAFLEMEPINRELNMLQKNFVKGISKKGFLFLKKNIWKRKWFFQKFSEIKIKT